MYIFRIYEYSNSAHNLQYSPRACLSMGAYNAPAKQNYTFKVKKKMVSASNTFPVQESGSTNASDRRERRN